MKTVIWRDEESANSLILFLNHLLLVSVSFIQIVFGGTKLNLVLQNLKAKKLQQTFSRANSSNAQAFNIDCRVSKICWYVTMCRVH